MESNEERSKRILDELKRRHPDANAFDLDGSGNHFVSELEPADDHPEWDRAIEVVFRSKPHKHLKMTQTYTILDGELTLHISDKTIHLKPGDKHIITPNLVHWAESPEGCWVEMYSEPGWTPEDHIMVELDRGFLARRKT